jgi:deoxyribodipyrimidine photo-lyase
VFENLKKKNIEFIGAKDHVVFEKNEVLKDNGTPYLVFTPYSRKWKSLFQQHYIPLFESSKNMDKLFSVNKSQNMLTLEDIGFEKNEKGFPIKEVTTSTLKRYEDRRNFPDKDGTTKVGIHLRFGTISIRSLVNQTLKNSETYLNELIWRDFYQMLIYHFPHSEKNSFRKEYDLIEWEKDMDTFKNWCDGKTGYPIVDAGMRELNQTGHMHNRVRMIVASFLTKHLLIDWRLGEAYFASKLLDYELASNVGGWQWASGSGCDAAPYFRIFNPTTQQQKFDNEMKYIKKWVPEINSPDYPEPIIDHKFARERALNRYKKGLRK